MKEWIDRPSLEEIDRAREVLLHQRKVHRRCAALLCALCVLLAGLGVAAAVLARPLRVEDTAMEPTLHVGSLVLTNTQDTTCARGKLVVLRLPSGEQMVRRVIGLPGDTVQIDPDTGCVSVNGEVLDEPYVSALTAGTLETDRGIVIPDGKLYVLGDERYGAQDSRSSSIWLVAQEDVQATVWGRLWPLGLVK